MYIDKEQQSTFEKMGGYLTREFSCMVLEVMDSGVLTI